MRAEYGVTISTQTVGNVIERQNTRGTVKRKVGSGRKRKTTKQEDSILKRQALKSRKQSLGRVGDEFEQSTNIRLSKPTISSRLHEKGIRSYACAKKPAISKANRQKRMAWVKKYKNESIEFWRKIIWSDESRFCLMSDRSERCLRFPGERFRPDCLTNTFKFGGGGLMAWGCFSGNGIGELCWVKSSMDAGVYIATLKNFLIPSIEKLHPDDDFIFQQDGAPCHMAKLTKSWFERQSLPWISDWPPQSPDLNPIENLWDFMERKLKGKHITSVKLLWEELKVIWASIPDDFIDKLINSMPARLEAVRKNRGGPTRY